jgi:hypothetical protein
VSTVGRALRRLYDTGWVRSHKGQRGADFKILQGQNDSAEEFLQGQNDLARKVKMTSQDSASLYEPDEVNQKNIAAAGANVPNAAAAAVLPAGRRNPDPVPDLAQKIAGELLKVHPQPGQPRRAAPEIERILRAAADPEAEAERIRRNHTAWMEYWATPRGQRIILQLWNWFQSGEWEVPPVFPKPVKSETWTERKERERKESDEKSYRGYAERGMWDILREYLSPDEVEAWREKVKAAS